MGSVHMKSFPSPVGSLHMESLTSPGCERNTKSLLPMVEELWRLEDVLKALVVFGDNKD